MVYTSEQKPATAWKRYSTVRCQCILLQALKKYSQGTKYRLLLKWNIALRLSPKNSQFSSPYLESVKHYKLFKTVSCGSRKGVSAPTFMCVLCFVFAYIQHAAVPAPIAHFHFKQQQMQVRMPACLWASVWKCTRTHKSEDRTGSTFTFKTSWRGKHTHKF